jgi:signal transduction histidine kinase
MDATRARTWRRVARFATAIVASEAITALMCLAFNGTVRLDFMVTGLVCAVAVHGGIERATRQYRHKLAEANAALEQRVAERTAALEIANHQLIARDRMATAGSLAAAVSHEIRTPLSVIVLAIDDIRADDLAPETREIVDDVAEAGQRIATILRDLSTFATPIDEPLGAVELGAVIDSAARLAAYQMRGRTQLVRDPCDVPPVIGSASRLVQVVLNLLVNAARAAKPDAPCTVRIGATVVGAEVVLRVADTGVGMDTPTRARLFEPYFTTRRDRGGTGLGLAICRDIVTAAGGHIEVASEPGVGTTMSVHLQVATETRAGGGARSRAAHRGPSRPGAAARRPRR